MNILPVSDIIDLNHTDTLGLRAYTVFEDSIRGSGLDQSHLGFLHDPVFGKTTGDFMAQLRLMGPFLDEDITVDSLTLYLQLDNQKGTDGTLHTLEIFEVEEYLDPDSTYYSNKEPVISDQPVATHTFVYYDTLEYIQMNMPQTLINRLFEDTAQLEHPQFMEYFNGLYFRLQESDEPAFFTVDVVSDNTRMDLYYRNDEGSERKYYFVINENSARISRYQHDYQAADADKQIQHINQQVTDSVVYVQGLGGTFARVSIPSLEAWRDSLPISVNKAQLHVRVSDDDQTLGDDFPAPSNLTLLYKDEEGNYQAVVDYTISTAYFGGRLDEDAYTYTFNIVGFVQLYLEGVVPSPEVYITPSLSNINRVVLSSNQNSQKMVFDFVYTLLD